MTDDLRDRVRRVLEEAEERSASLDADGAGEDDVAGTFGDVAERANELVSNADPAELLDAVGSEAVSEEDPPETIAEGMERSDQETVLSLRKLLALSRIAREEDEDTRAERIETFRELSREDAAAEDEPEGTGADGDAGEPVEEPSADQAGGEPSDSSDEPDDADRLREALLGEVEGFREEIRAARAELEADEDGEDENTPEMEDDSRTEEDEDGSESAGTDRRPSGSDGTMFSTVPSRNRADMRGTGRFSTVRKK